MTENDALIARIVIIAITEDNPNGDEQLDRYLTQVYDEIDARITIDSIRDVLRTRNTVIAKYLADSKDIFIIRLFACLTAELYKAFLDYGAPKEAFHGIGLVWKKISEEVGLVQQMKRMTI